MFVVTPALTINQEKCCCKTGDRLPTTECYNDVTHTAVQFVLAIKSTILMLHSTTFPLSYSFVRYSASIALVTLQYTAVFEKTSSVGEGLVYG